MPPPRLRQGQRGRRRSRLGGGRGSHKRWRGPVVLRSRCGLTKYAAQRGSSIYCNLWKFKVLSRLKRTCKLRKCSEKARRKDMREEERRIKRESKAVNKEIGWQGGKVKERKMREKLDSRMTKNGQMRAGWERASHRSFLTFLLTHREGDGSEIHRELSSDQVQQWDNTTSYWLCRKEMWEKRKWEHTCSLDSVSLSHAFTDTQTQIYTLTKHSREQSVTTMSTSMLNECHDVMIQP